MITLTASGGSVTFEFSGNSTYLNDGQITVPVNSLALIIDESDMATFRKAASNDIFVSANIAEFGMTKAELESWYKANMVGSTGGGGGATYSAGDGINIDSANTISAVYRGYVTMNPQYSVENYSGQLYIANIGNDIIDTFWTAEQSWDYAYFFSFDFTAKTYSITSAPQGRENDWQNYFTIEFDEDVQMFKVTTLQEVTYINSGGWSNILRIGSEYNDYSVLYSGATSDALDGIFNALDNKQDTLTAGSGISISGNVISATGGGGTDAPISAGTGTDSVKENYVNNVASGSYSHAEGQFTNANGSNSHAEGTSTNANGSNSHAEGKYSQASGQTSHAEGDNTRANGIKSHAEGGSTVANGSNSHAEGSNTIANNKSEHASGMYNVSNTGESTSAQTLFSVGNGGWDETAQDIVRHNAFEIRQNGDIYLSSGGTDIKLQDHLGGGGCEVEETVVYDRNANRYTDYNGDNKLTYVVINYLGDKSQASNMPLGFSIGDASSDLANSYIYFDYVNHSASTDISTDYLTVEYINDIQDFKVSITSAYQSDYWIKDIYNLNSEMAVLIPYYTINSGSPCTVITTDVVGLVTKVKNNADKSVSDVYLNSGKDNLGLNYSRHNGLGGSSAIGLEEIDGTNNKLKPNIKVGLGVSGWTEIGLSDSTCQLSDNKVKGFTTFRISGDTTQLYNWNLQFAVGYNNNWTWDTVQWDDNENTFVLSKSWDMFSAATATWDSNTGYLTVSYPQTVTVDGEERQTEFYYINSQQCQYGYAISKFEYYAELQQPLKPYVQETRAALGGLSLVKLTKAEYDALATKDDNTLYVVIPNP